MTVGSPLRILHLEDDPQGRRDRPGRARDRRYRLRGHACRNAGRLRRCARGGRLRPDPRGLLPAFLRWLSALTDRPGKTPRGAVHLRFRDAGRGGGDRRAQDRRIRTTCSRTACRGSSAGAAARCVKLRPHAAPERSCGAWKRACARRSASRRWARSPAASRTTSTTSSARSWASARGRCATRPRGAACGATSRASWPRASAAARWSIASSRSAAAAWGSASRCTLKKVVREALDLVAAKLPRRHRGRGRRCTRAAPPCWATRRRCTRS